MSRFRRFDIVDRSSSFFFDESSLLAPRTLALAPFCSSRSYLVEDELDFDLDIFSPPTLLGFPSPLDDFDSITDLIQIGRTPFCSTTRRVQRRVGLGRELYLQPLCEQVSDLELSFDRFVNPKPVNVGGDRKYTWTAEIKSPEKDGLDRKYKWLAEVKGEGNGGAVEKSYKWTAEVKGKGDDSPISRTYTFKVSTGDAGKITETKKRKNKEKMKEKTEKIGNGVRVVEIGELCDHGALILRQAFAKRAENVLKKKGKRKELSPQDAAMMIQMTFRSYLIRRSQSLRALRELAIAKTKLREIRSLFNNFSYRRRLDRDSEERQRFSEKIIVLLLTVDAIEGADMMVRALSRRWREQI